MEQQKLPNVTLSLILSILSFICCCFSAGIGGIVLSGIAFLLTKKDENLYKQNPENYSNYSTLKTVKIVAIIGLVLGVCSLIWTIYSVQQMGGWDAYMEQIQDMMDQLQ
ncbi:CCC motif membrane protein [Maribacter polysaccharolyticus]|uniref:CCC motif membrane protein n=1 Tax=Maribacter polysaccharolyticus TaxID=3020831 RepID=UPI00237FC024|nr:CCC motif membrane protein [Maribacter polysaccharolyticus]MDE3743775.1 CCC motif membrane protein [Maribacter polysaccharolyticus]